MADFRAFLGSTKEVVLPYFGGTRIDAPDRRLRVTGEADHDPGWYKTKIDGRRATLVERGQPADLTDRPAIRGHWAEGWVFVSGREWYRIALPPDEEPSALSRCTGRKWHSGDVLFDTIDFEDDAEVTARDALERGTAIADLKGAAPSLRAAFGFAVVSALGRELDIPISPFEIAGLALEISARGRPAAQQLLDVTVQERARAAAEMQRRERERLAHLAEEAHMREMAEEERRAYERIRNLRPRHQPRSANWTDRVDEALDAAGARMLRCRRMSDGMLEVRFELDGQPYICVVHQDTLQVFDAGICLSGADRVLTLDSLPSVIREAITNRVLHITRRA